jgi:hypothetical protein
MYIFLHYTVLLDIFNVLYFSTVLKDSLHYYNLTFFYIVCVFLFLKVENSNLFCICKTNHFCIL